LKADDYEAQGNPDDVLSKILSKSNSPVPKRRSPNYKYINRIVLGDCFEICKDLDTDSIHLVVTSSPYVDMRGYGKEIPVYHPDDYVDWILPRLRESYRILHPSASFILNINDRVVKKERHPFVHELICRVAKETDLQHYDTYFWVKKCTLPNGNRKRLNNTTEYLLHFCKDVNLIKWNMDEVREPYDPNTVKRCKYPVGSFNLEVDEEGRPKERDRKVIQLNEKGKIPSNVFQFPTAAAVRGKCHPAAFHIDLPSWFIKALTDEGDTVLDMFAGSGTTCLAAKKLNRKYIGIELNEKYHEIATQRVENADMKKAA
jgi:DNA modification methylase